MPTWVWIVIALGVAAAALAIGYAITRARRTRRLHGSFGSEYDRVAADAPTRREAEAELEARQSRHEEFDIRPLDPQRQQQLLVRWTEVQATFVDEPDKAIARADSLIQEAMRERGYPVEDFDTRAGDLSVDHGEVVENYRAAHGIRTAHERGRATTDDLRRAMQHYRALFVELVGAEVTNPA